MPRLALAVASSASAAKRLRAGAPGWRRPGRLPVLPHCILRGGASPEVDHSEIIPPTSSTAQTQHPLHECMHCVPPVVSTRVRAAEEEPEISAGLLLRSGMRALGSSQKSTAAAGVSARTCAGWPSPFHPAVSSACIRAETPTAAVGMVSSHMYHNSLDAPPACALFGGTIRADFVFNQSTINHGWQHVGHTSIQTARRPTHAPRNTRKAPAVSGCPLEAKGSNTKPYMARQGGGGSQTQRLGTMRITSSEKTPTRANRRPNVTSPPLAQASQFP
jgi:hypothetical protein